MGLFQAIKGAVGGTLADQWLEVIEPDEMSADTLFTRGVTVRPGDKRSANRKGTEDTVSNGSVIHVYDNQFAFVVDGGRMVDYTAEPGYYTVQNSSAPSVMNGQLGEAVGDAFNRIRFGGVPSGSQRVYYINLQEIRGIRFGTKSPVSYFDRQYNAELFMRAHGTYSIKVTNPVLFYTEAVPRNSDRLTAETLNAQLLDEFLTALQSSMSQMSVDGLPVTQFVSRSQELCRYLSTALDESWEQRMGMQIVAVGITPSYDEQSRKLIDMRNQAAILSDPNLRETYVQTSVARGIEAAGSNAAGASVGFMGMNMGMQSAGGFMATASQTNQQQMQAAQQAAAVQQAAGWKCGCGAQNTGKFCSECGKPAPAAGWVCSCGVKNTGKFCSECGKPAPAAQWVCACGTENSGKFCQDCGATRP